MSEELKTEQEVSQVSEIEQKALEMGWRPKDEFDGDETEFIDAKEFVRRQPLFDKISHQSREIKEVRKALEALKIHYTTVRESEFERALSTLKKERKDALSNGDGDRFDQLDDEIKVVEKQVESIKAVKDSPIVQEASEHPEFTAWKNQNRWYESTSYMRKFADDFGTELAARGIPPADVLKQVAQAVKKEFPSKFVNSNKENAAPVNSGASGGGQRSVSIEGSLTEQERTVMGTLVRSGTLTKEKYLAALKAVKERS
jgi:hypothetical protein